MRYKMMLILLVIFVGTLTVMPTAFAEGQWMKAANYTDVALLIWDPSPVEGETVSWEGGKINQYELTGKESGFPLYYAHQYGIAKWYVNGEFSQSDEGTFYGGKRHGEIVQRFADGRVVTAVWEHGVRVK